MANKIINSLQFNSGDINILSLPYGICETAADTAAKAVTVENFALETGAQILVKFTVTNSASSPTLNINETGAKNIMYRGSAIGAGYLAANRVYEFVYDGIDWELVGDLFAETSISVGNKSSTDTTDLVYAVTNLVESGTKNHTITPTYTGLPTKTYVDKIATGHVKYLGTVAALTGLSTTAGQGDFYRVSTAFTFGSETAHVGDIILATKDNPAQNATDWDLIHAEIDSNSWVANTASAAGYVAKGSGNANKVWKTDGSGNPAWRDDANTTYTFNGAVSTIKDSNLTASRALISNSSGKVAISDTTSTELGYVHGVTSAIQTQLNSKISNSGDYTNKYLAWNSSSYLQNVILLIPVLQSNNWCGFNYIDGKFFLWKTGGNVYDVIKINANCVYDSLRYHLEMFGDHPTATLCVCKYNNILYYAIKCPYHANPYTHVTFTGRIKSELSGGTTTVDLPLQVPYYDENTQTVLNTEVKNSITDTLTTTYVTSASGTPLCCINGFKGSLNGNASTATTANTLTGLTYAGSSASWGNQTGTCRAYWSTASGGGIQIRDDNPTAGQVSLLIDGTVYVNEGANPVLHTGNYNSYALPLSGGTITGALTVSNESMSISKGTPEGLTAGTSKLYANGLAISNPAIATDACWIRVTGTGETDTVLEIATGDDGGGSGCEKIVARQYEYSNGNIAKEAVLLNTDGTTSFPVSVTAPTFIGTLSGNATTATKLATARTISLTGDVTGSTTFDGSGNASITATVADDSHNHTILKGNTSGVINMDAADGTMRYDYNIVSTATGLFPTENNANAIITISKHSGAYDSQLGFSANGKLYYRNFNAANNDTTTGWSQIAFTSSKVSSASNADYSVSSGITDYLRGIYTGNGGAQGPSYVGTNRVRCNMMQQFVGTDVTTFGSYADVLMMNAYNWNDVPYATALAIQKTGGKPRAWIAAGGNSSTWSGATELITANNISSYALPLSGGQMTGAITFNATAASLSTSTPMSITYGRIAAYGTLCINGNTDNSGTEYVLITAGKGLSSTLTDGLAIGTSSLQWQGQEIIHSGNIGAQAVNYANSAGSANSVAWGNVSGKPSTFTPSSHTHSISQITSLQSTLNAKLSTSGGTLSGHLTINGGELTVSNRINTRTSLYSIVADHSVVFNDIEYNTAPSKYSIAAGYRTATDSIGGLSIGSCTKANANVSTLFKVGNGYVGTSSTYYSNAAYLSSSGLLALAGSVSSGGADYAEYFEWEDGNINNDDRRGYFVTISNEKIKIARTNDYILGVVSAQPTVIGNSDIDWQGRYIKDEFGTVLTEMVDCIEGEKINEITGEKIPIIKKVLQPKQNPNYDPERQYIPREQRPEWDAVGMMGVLAVRDDGTCQVNSYCKVTDEGTATASNTGYRVIARVNDHVIKIVLK